MSDSVTLTATPRTSYGSRASQKLRKQGQLPAIVYGHKEAVVSVTVPYLEFDRAVRVKHVRVLDLVIGAKTEKVLIRELQWDHLGSEMVHVDFARVSKDEKVKVTIPVKLKNAPKSTGGGVLDQPFHTLHVECLAIAIPEEITIDVTDLTLGHPIHVRELKLPEGVTVLEGPETIVVQLKLPGQEPAPTSAIPGAEAGAGPELIKKEKKTDDEEPAEKKK
ncbi:MAG: 50S ribosomal protein L25 [Gemmataceae bacterium]